MSFSYILESRDFYFQRGFAAIGSTYNRIVESSQEKELQRKKEVDDLISKYSTKKKLPDHQTHAHGATLGVTEIKSDYLPSTRYGSYRDSLYGATGSLGRRRSGVFESLPDTTTSQSSTGFGRLNLYGRQNDFGSVNTGSAPRRFIASSKSSTNLYLSPNSTSTSDLGSKLAAAESPRTSGRHQKTLSLHGLSSFSSGNSANPLTTGNNPLLPSGSFSSLSSLQLPTTDWSWPGRTNLSPYSKYADPLTSPLKGLGFWQNSSSLLTVNGIDNQSAKLCFLSITNGYSINPTFNYLNLHDQKGILSNGTWFQAGFCRGTFITRHCFCPTIRLVCIFVSL